jgi:hypothetical protein
MMATTTDTHDYLGRALQNATPGVTDPVLDYLGRETLTGDVDYMGRDLQTPA